MTKEMKKIYKEVGDILIRFNGKRHEAMEVIRELGIEDKEFDYETKKLVKSFVKKYVNKK